MHGPSRVTMIDRLLRPFPAEAAGPLADTPAITVILDRTGDTRAADEALGRLAACARSSPATPLRPAIADVLGDPAARILFPDPDLDAAWVDEAGRPALLPGPGNGRMVSEVRAGDVLLAAIVHDASGPGARPVLRDACVAVTGVVLDNRRLAAEAARSLGEMQRSRARLASSAARERRRIERDLHDGAQQRLVALRIELDMAEDVVRRDPERGAALLRELGRSTEEALDEIRALAQGVYPALLADRGLVPALRAVAARTPVATEVSASGVARYSTEVESAVYFCVLEALQNVAKHATGARRVAVRLEQTGDDLCFEVTDDGAGPAGGTIRPGAGITNMGDRLAAVSGDVRVARLAGGSGTVVAGRVPVPAASPGSGDATPEPRV